MNAVSNSSPLIFSAKIKELMPLLEKKFDNILVPEQVFEEVFVKALNSPNPLIQENAVSIQKFFNSGFLVKKEIKSEIISELDFLGLGEASAIALAVKTKTNFILIDEKKGTNFAKLHGLTPIPITAVIIEAKLKNWIKKEKAEKLLEELLANNYRIDIKSFNSVKKLLD